MKAVLLLLPLLLFSESALKSCKAALKKQSRIHPILHKEIKAEIENNLLIIEACQSYPDVKKEAKLYNEYLLFKYLRLPTIQVHDEDLIERCRRISQKR